MGQARALFFLLTLSGCDCASGVVSLPGSDAAAKPGSDRADPGPDRTVEAECMTAWDCPQAFPACPDRNSCRCGTYKTCEQGRCLAFSNDFCGFDAGLDAGAECTFATDCPGSPPACDPPFNCGCGFFKTCERGQCQELWIELCGDGGSPDTGVPRPERCSVYHDCARPLPETVGFCGAAGRAVWSCIAGVCTAECGPARTCEIDPGPQCQRCMTDTATIVEADCRADHCDLPPQTITVQVEATTCDVFPGTTRPFDGTRITLSPQSSTLTCRYSMVQAAGVDVLGELYEYDSHSFLADIPGFGGYCTGVWLPTGAGRVLFSCPSCQFVLLF